MPEQHTYMVIDMTFQLLTNCQQLFFCPDQVKKRVQ